MSALTSAAMLLVAATSFATTRDDSVEINSNIALAIKNGFSSYTIPAGTYVLQNPVVIPNGAKNFTLKGAGSSKTILTTPNVSLTEELLVGSVPVLHNNWVLTNRTNYPIKAVAQGASSVSLVKNNVGVAPNHYYVIWDTHTEWANNTNQTCVMNHAEIVKVTKSVGGVLTLDAPTSREYDKTAELCDVNAIMCTNIGISGIGFNGNVTGSGMPSQSFVAVGLADGVTATDIKGTGFMYTALDFVNTRNVLVNGANLSGAAAGGPGEGYGVTFSRCRYATATNCVATGLRHGFIFHAGTTDSGFSNCSSMGGGGFDAHGMDERRLTLTKCVTDDVCQFGNQAWPEGDRNITVNGGSYASGINVCAYTNYVSVTNADLGRLVIWSEITGFTNPPANQYADNLSFTNCAFVAPYYLITEDNRLGKASFSNCSFEATNAAWGNVFVLKKTTGTFNFSQCTFKLDSTRQDLPLVFSMPTTGFSLNLSNSVITAQGGGPTSTQYASTFAGKATMTNNTFVSMNGKNPSFLSNLSKVNVVSTGNTAKVGH